MIAIIPARGGSKGLPGKNIKLLNGKPLIAYTIEAAKNAEQISRVIVSTDDAEIAKNALEYGAECPFMRPDFLATDEARSIDVLKYTINKLEETKNRTIEEIIVLQPTSPLRTSRNIDEAIELFRSKKADSVVSYCQEHHPIFWHKYITEDGRFEDIFENTIRNRQEEKPTYFPNGAIYIFSREMVFSEKYYSENSFAYIMDRKVSIDIDTEDDFDYVQYLLGK